MIQFSSMKTYNLYLIFFFFPITIFSQPLTWDKNYSFPEKDDAYFIKMLQTEKFRSYQ